MTQSTSSVKARSAPVSIRLNASERARLVKAAAAMDMTLSEYIRARLFASDITPQICSPEMRQRLVARFLAELGKSGIGGSLSELAEAASLGLLPATPDTMTEIAKTCDQVAELRSDLLHALGLRPRGER